MVIFIFLVTFLSCSFLLFAFRPKEPNGIVLYFANVGTGKTTFLAKIAQKEIKRIRKGKSRFKYIASNAQIEGTRYIPDLRAIMKSGAMPDTLLLIDEASIEYNNKKQNLNDIELQIFKLIRHYNMTAIVVSQSYNDIDVTLRRLYTEIYLLNYLPWFTMIRPIKKYVGIDDATHDIVDMYKFRFFFSYRFFLRPKYFKYFNSWWIPSHIHLHDLEDFKITPPKEKKKKSRLKLIKDTEIKERIADGETEI